MKDQHFENETDLFTAIQTEWDFVKQGLINNLLCSFRARCQVYVTHNGESLNGYWREVRATHYRPDPWRVPVEPDEME